MDTAQHEHTLCLRRKLIYDVLKIAQLVAREQLFFAVICLLQCIQIRHGFERDHLAAPRDVDHQIARDRVEIGAPCRNPLPFLGRISPRQHF